MTLEVRSARARRTGAGVLVALGLGMASCAVTPDERQPPSSAPNGSSIQRLTESEHQAYVELQSSDPARLAWGAWHARGAALVPDVVEALTRVRSLPDVPERRWVVRALLDAAIRLDARPRAEDLAWVVSEIRQPVAEVLILAAREPRASLALLETLAAREESDRTLAASNLLARHAPERLAPRLVRMASIRIRVQVHDPDSGMGRGRARGRSIGCGSLTAPPGFPPTVVHELVQRSLGAPDVFADGPIPIGYEREVHASPSFGTSVRREPTVPAEYALRLLAWIDGERTNPPFLAHEIDVQHAWSDAETYRREVGAAIETRRRAWVERLDRLLARGILERDALGGPSPFTIEIVDARADRAVALPALEH